MKSNHVKILRDARADYDEVNLWHYPATEDSEEYISLEQAGWSNERDNVLITRDQAIQLREALDLLLTKTDK